MCITYQISQRLFKPLLRYTDFPVSRMATVRSWILTAFGFFNADTFHRDNMRHLAKFIADRSNVAEGWPFFDFSRWRPSAILDLLYACLEPPTKSGWWSLSLYKIWLESAA